MVILRLLQIYNRRQPHRQRDQASQRRSTQRKAGRRWTPAALPVPLAAVKRTDLIELLLEVVSIEIDLLSTCSAAAAAAVSHRRRHHTLPLAHSLPAAAGSVWRRTRAWHRTWHRTLALAPLLLALPLLTTTARNMPQHTLLMHHASFFTPLHLSCLVQTGRCCERQALAHYGRSWPVEADQGPEAGSGPTCSRPGRWPGAADASGPSA